MKKLLYISLFLLTLSACTIERSNNGKLDGFWHLEKVDTIETGGVRDLSNEKIFWSVQNKLLYLQGGKGSYFLRFEQTSDSLIIHSPYTNGGHEEQYGSGGDKPLTDPTNLRSYGIEDLEVHYKKESMSSSRMILRSNKVRLQFKKF